MASPVLNKRLFLISSPLQNSTSSAKSSCNAGERRLTCSQKKVLWVRGGGVGTMSLSSEYIASLILRRPRSFAVPSIFSLKRKAPLCSLRSPIFFLFDPVFCLFPWSQVTQATIDHKAPVVQAICAGYRRTGDCSANQHQYPPRIATWLLSCTWWTVMF